MKFAVVDIETTGLFHQGHDITEIAVVHVDDDCSRLAFHSLVHTSKIIPGQITGLTGITNSDTNEAPTFNDLAPALCSALEGRVFVAHNVNFDYQFLKANFEGAGMEFKFPRLCTYRYAKKVLPHLNSYKLGAVCKALKIENSDAHRAGGDALAAAEILQKLRAIDAENHLSALLNQNSRNAILPPSIGTEIIDKIPERPGVYYFYNHKEVLIYIGKSKNLKKRVLSHFTSSGSSRKKQIFQKSVSRIEYRETSTEFEALLMEDSEIKKNWPALNVAQKRGGDSFAIVSYFNRKNEMRFAIVKSKFRLDSLAWFTTYHNARLWLQEELSQRLIHPKRGGFYADPLLKYPNDVESLTEFLDERKSLMGSSYALLLQTDEEKTSFAAVIRGKYRGYGKLPIGATVDIASIESALVSAPDSSTARAVLEQMMNDKNVLKYDF